VIPLSEIDDYGDKALVILGGEIEKIMPKVDKRNQKYYKFTLRHTDNTINCTLFASNVENYEEILINGVGKVIEVRGQVNDYMGNRGIIANFIREIEVR